MDDKNKIKNLEIQIDNLITEKHIKERNNTLLKLQNKKEEDKLMSDIINLLDNKNNDMTLNITDIILGVALIIFVFTDFKKICSLNIIVTLIIIVILISISVLNELKFNIFSFIKILLGVCLIGIIYFDKIEYFDFYVFKVVFCLIGLYMIYNSFSNNKNNKKSLPDYRNKFPQKDELKFSKKKYEGGEFKGCVNLDNINKYKSENKLFYKGSIYDLGTLIIDNKTILDEYKEIKEQDSTITKYDDEINKRHMYNECLLLLSRLKQENMKADLVFLLEILINDNRGYLLDGNEIKYTKGNLSEIIKLISAQKYNVGSICFNNMSV